MCLSYVNACVFDREFFLYHSSPRLDSSGSTLIRDGEFGVASNDLEFDGSLLSLEIVICIK